MRLCVLQFWFECNVTTKIIINEIVKWMNDNDEDDGYVGEHDDDDDDTEVDEI